MLSLERRKEIKEFTETVRRALGLQESLYDIHKAINLLRGTIEWGQSPIKDTCITNTGKNSFTIALSEIAVPSYERWYLGHILGHIFLHMGYLSDPEFWSLIKEYKDTVFNKQHTQVHETEAYEFASNLLLPEEEFRRVCKQNLVEDRYRVLDIGMYFGVPIGHVKSRGRSLGIFS